MNLIELIEKRAYMQSTSPAFGSDEWQPFINQSSLPQFDQALPHFSPTEWSAIFFALKTQPAIQYQEKLNHLFDHISHLNQFHLLGQSLSADSLICFLSYLISHPSHLKSFASVLIHLSPSVFLEALPRFQVLLLKLHMDHLFEPLCYQLTLFIHLYEDFIQMRWQDIQLLKQKITTHDFSLLSSLKEEIEEIVQEVQEKLNLLDIALEIAWKTERPDLVAKFSELKEQLNHLLSHQIGFPSTLQNPSSGLYASIDQSFNAVFDRLLKNEDAALEGLTCLNLWNIKDYWEVGLLPQLPSPTEFIEQDTKTLMDQVQENLASLYLKTVQDLKRERLFSSQQLKEYIQKHHQLLIR